MSRMGWCNFSSSLSNSQAMCSRGRLPSSYALSGGLRSKTLRILSIEKDSFTIFSQLSSPRRASVSAKLVLSKSTFPCGFFACNLLRVSDQRESFRLEHMSDRPWRGCLPSPTSVQAHQSMQQYNQYLCKGWLQAQLHVPDQSLCMLPKEPADPLSKND